MRKTDSFITYKLTQIVDKPTCVPDTTGHHISLLDHFLISCPEKCFVEVLPPLGTSDHSLINVKIDGKSKAFPDVPFHRTIFQYTKTDSDSFRSYITEAPLLAFFKNKADRTTLPHF